MFFEIRAAVKFVTDNTRVNVPLEFIKDYRKTDFQKAVNLEKTYEVFYSRKPSDHPQQIEAEQGRVINVDEAVESEKDPKEKARLRKSPGYFFAKVIAVKDNEDELLAYLNNKDSRKVVKVKSQDTAGKELKGKEAKSDVPAKKSKVKTRALVKTGASSSLKRVMGDLFPENPSKKSKPDVLEEEVESEDWEDSDDDFADKTMISWEEHTEKLQGAIDEWKEKTNDLRQKNEQLLDKYSKMKAKYKKFVDLYLEKDKFFKTMQETNLEMQRANLELQAAYMALKSSQSKPVPTTPESTIAKSPVSKGNRTPSTPFRSLESVDMLPYSTPKSKSSTVLPSKDIVFTPPTASTSSSDENELFSKPHLIKPSLAIPQKSLSNNLQTVPKPATVFTVQRKPVSQNEPIISESSLSKNDEENGPTETDNEIPEKSSPPLTSNNFTKLNEAQLKLCYRGTEIGAKGDSLFVRQVTQVVFSEEELLNSSVLGRKPNILKGKTEEVKPALDPARVQYVRELLEDRIRKEWSEDVINEGRKIDDKKDIHPRSKHVYKYIAAKISSTRRSVAIVKGKSVNNEEMNVEPEQNVGNNSGTSNENKGKEREVNGTDSGKKGNEEHVRNSHTSEGSSES